MSTATVDTRRDDRRNDERMIEGITTERNDDLPSAHRKTQVPGD